jgi:hypothetical protein
VLLIQCRKRRNKLDSFHFAQDARRLTPVMQRAPVIIFSASCRIGESVHPAPAANEAGVPRQRGTSCVVMLRLKYGVARLAAQQLEISGRVRGDLPKLFHSTGEPISPSDGTSDGVESL